MQILKDMTPEEGVAMLKQFLNPRIGLHVGYIRENNRGKVPKMAQKEQDKIEEKSLRRTPRQLDLFAEGASIHSRIEAPRRKPKEAASAGNKGTKGARV